ncbi:hypothetical protein, partial [Thermus scotoductus]
MLVYGPGPKGAPPRQGDLPGGCAVGARPVDQHVKALRALGAEVVE